MGRLNDIKLATRVAVLQDRRAFDQLVREYQSPVRRFLLSQTLGNETLTDDLAQETFLKAYTHISQYRGTSSMLTWLTRIAYNVFYDYKRSERVKVDSVAAAGNAGFTVQPALKSDLYTALATLRDEERTCVTLQLIDGYAIAEIAGMTGMAQNTVKSHLKRGKEKLANY